MCRSISTSFVALLLLAASKANTESITVDCSQSTGSYKNLHRNWAGGFAAYANPANLKPLVEQIGATSYRVPFLCPPNVFKGKSLEEAQDPAMYHFGESDPPAANVAELGLEMFAMIENVPPQLSADGTDKGPPTGENLAVFAEVVKRVVMHYTQGWANGFKYPIRYWEIWNEPDLADIPAVATAFWTGTQQQIFDMYAAVSSAIASIELLPGQPPYKIGGPAFAHLEKKWHIPFLEFCEKKELRLDFFSFHHYDDNPLGFLPVIEEAERALAKHPRYAATELILNEWNMQVGPWGDGPGNRSGMDMVFYVICNPKYSSPEAAVHMARVLMLMQRSPLDMANHFLLADNGVATMGAITCTEIPFPPASEDAPTREPGCAPKPKFYTAKAFERFSATPQLVQVKITGESMDALAGVSDARDVAALLLVNWGNAESIELRLDTLPWDGAYQWRAEAINAATFEQAVDSVALTSGVGEGGSLELTLDIPAASLVLLRVEKS